MGRPSPHQEHIDRVVAEAPPLTEEQRDRIAGIFRGGKTAPTVQKSPRQIEREKEAADRAEKARKVREAVERMSACAVCELPEVAHRVHAAASPFGFHEWEPKEVTS